MQVSDLLQTVKVMLNRSVAFPLKADQVQKINACIDKLVVGGRVFEQEEIDAFLNPPVVETTPEQEASLQALVDESQAMGLYEMTGNSLVKDSATQDADLEPGGLMAINPEHLAQAVIANVIQNATENTMM